jgi:16S rRNA G966 N2-methylase RsmD
MKLIKYDAACRAVAEAKAVDEVKEIRNAAIAMAAYAKQAKDRGMEADAAEIRLRATRRLGEMMQAQKETVGLATGREGKRKSLGLPENPSDRPTLESQGIDKNLAHEARTLGGMTEEEFEQQVEEAREYVAYGKREILDIARSIRAQELQQRDDQIKEAFHRPVQVDSRLHVGDFRDLAHVIPDNSVELVFIDPPYDRESIPLYEAAAKEAARILKPGGSLICYTGQVIHPYVLPLMMQHLKYYWIGGDVHDDGPFTRMERYAIIVGQVPLLWFVKEYRGDRRKFIFDSPHSPREKDVHPWQKSLATALHFIDGLTSENGVVVDFFAGGGTTIIAAQRLNRPWVAFEIDEAVVPAIMDRIGREAILQKSVELNEPLSCSL